MRLITFAALTSPRGKDEPMTTPITNERVMTCLQEQLHRIRPPYAAQKLWEDVLTSDERTRLGDNLGQVYRSGGTVGIWKLLHSVSDGRAIAEVAYRLGFISVETLNWLLRELGETTQTGSPPDDRPVWNRDQSELKYQGKLARRVLRPRHCEECCPNSRRVRGSQLAPLRGRPFGTESQPSAVPQRDCVHKQVVEIASVLCRRHGPAHLLDDRNGLSTG